jgi:hypothetical protein
MLSWPPTAPLDTSILPALGSNTGQRERSALREAPQSPQSRQLASPPGALVACTEPLGLALTGSPRTLEAGCDAPHNQDSIQAHPMQPVLSPQRRQAKTLSAIVARPLGWHDTVRQFVISAARLPEIPKAAVWSPLLCSMVARLSIRLSAYSL